MPTSQSSLPYKAAEVEATELAASLHHQKVLRDNSVNSQPERNSFYKQTACSGIVRSWSIAYGDVTTTLTRWHKYLTENELSLNYFTSLLSICVFFIIIYSCLVIFFKTTIFNTDRTKWTPAFSFDDTLFCSLAINWNIVPIFSLKFLCLKTAFSIQGSIWPTENKVPPFCFWSCECEHGLQVMVC